MISIKFKNSIISVIILSMLLLVSCGETNEPAQGQTDTTFSGIAGKDTSQEQTETEYVSANLPERDFNGEEFSIFGRIYSSYWSAIDIDADEQNGDAINDAVYQRNSNIEEKYNLKITAVPSEEGTMANKMETVIMSGDNVYDAMVSNTYDAAAVAQAGMLTDLKTVGNLDLSSRWWNPNLNDCITIMDKQYYMTGDISIIDNYSIRCVFFNKKIAENHNLDDPYVLVREGKWTLDKFFGMANAVTTDLNGDSVVDETDLTGISAQTTLGMLLTYASGVKITEKDENDIPHIVIENERSLTVMNHILELMSTNSRDLYLTEKPDDMLIRFGADLSLFHAEVLMHIKTMRGYENEIGILPNPKFDESQDEYIQYADGWCVNMYTIPITNDSPNDIGFVLEALAADSLNNLTPAFYDICLNGKYLRDQESSEMLDIILNTYVMDNINIFQWGKLCDSVQKAMSAGQDIASTIAKNIDSTNVAITKTLTALSA